MIEALLGYVQKLGPSAICAVLAIIVIHLHRQITKNFEGDAARYEKLKNSINGAIASLKDEVSKRIDEHDKRLGAIEREYTTKAEFFREFGGWKTDFNRMSDQISRVSETVSKQFTELTTKIIELWRDK